MPVSVRWHRREAATAETLRDGWLRTGDLVRRDADGFHQVLGRIKDVIRRSGENISATGIETVLTGLPEVVEAAAIPVPDDLRGEEVKVCLVLQPGPLQAAALHRLSPRPAEDAVGQDRQGRAAAGRRGSAPRRLRHERCAVAVSGGLLHLSAADVEACGITPAEMNDAVEAGFLESARGAGMMRPALSIPAGDGASFRAKGGLLGGAGFAAVKWYGYFPGNVASGLPEYRPLVLLSETTRGFPVAIMDGTLITTLRTAAISAVAAKYLAKSADTPAHRQVIRRVGEHDPGQFVLHQPPVDLRIARVAAQQAVRPQLPQVAVTRDRRGGVRRLRQASAGSSFVAGGPSRIRSISAVWKPVISRSKSSSSSARPWSSILRISGSQPAFSASRLSARR
jgi:hypothetical protein